MNGAQLHLMLNHLPVLGALFTVLLLGWALVRRTPELLKTALVVALIAGLSSIPVYQTGEAAEKVIEHLPGVEERFIEQHESQAKYALGLGIVMSVVAAGTLAVGLRNAQWLRGGAALTWVASLLAFLVMAYTAHSGGMIRHPEIRSDFTAAPTAAGEESREPHSDERD